MFFSLNGQNRQLKSSKKHVSKRFEVFLRYEREKSALIVRAKTPKRMVKNMGINTTTATIALRLLMAEMLSSTRL
jgi:diketogulonate reductase-like aldo/keto reductase